MFLQALKILVNKHLTAGDPKPMRTKTPMRLSQDSSVTISITPLILAEIAGALFKNADLPTTQKIDAVGELAMLGLTYHRCYLSQTEGAFIQFASRGAEILETRLFRMYDSLPREGDPNLTAQDWAFWLADDDGYIGLPVMQSSDADGGLPYQRTWGGGDQRVNPMMVTERIVGITGYEMFVRHRMMLYSRTLTDPKLAEHLLVSAVETDSGASVNLWLGLDLATNDLTAFAAADAPL